jgi:hypothetical protein
VFVGELVNRRFSVQRFYNVVYVAVILMGILIFL